MMAQGAKRCDIAKRIRYNKLYNNINTSKMNTISINYALVYQLSFAPNYQWTKDGLCFNTKTNKELNQKYNSRCLGYYIKGKFYSLTYLRTCLELIPKPEYPF